MTLLSLGTFPRGCPGPAEKEKGRQVAGKGAGAAVRHWLGGHCHEVMFGQRAAMPVRREAVSQAMSQVSQPCVPDFHQSSVRGYLCQNCHLR